MPENSSRWPTFYRKHAEELMAQHFPEGYEVVRAEEVVEGSRTLTIKGASAAELDAAGPSQILSLARLGRTTSRSQLDSMKLKECRILYKKAEGPGSHPAHRSGDFADQASWSPGLYLDPNEPERRAAREKTPGESGPAVAVHQSTTPKPPEPHPPGPAAETDEPVLLPTTRTSHGVVPKLPASEAPPAG